MTVQKRPFTPRDKFMCLTAQPVIAMMALSIPMYFTYVELVYARYGKVVDATVTHRKGGSVGGGRSGPMRPVLNIEYSFQDNSGHQQTGDDALPSGWSAEKGQSIKVEYVPGSEGMSRAAGNKPHLTNMWLLGGGVTVFCLAAAWLVWKTPTTPRIENH